MPAETILRRLEENSRKAGTQTAFYEKQDGEWQSTSWSDYWTQVKQAARAFAALGIGKGDVVAILGFNRPQWVIADLGAMMAGGVPTGIYQTSAPREVAYILGATNSSVLVVEDNAHWQKVAGISEEVPALQHVIMMKEEPSDAGPGTGPDIMSWPAFLDRAQTVTEEEIARRVEATHTEDLASLIYTSGTTGEPKGVMLTHENLTWESQLIVDAFELTDEDVVLSYLPLSHIAEQLVSIHNAITAGYTVYFAESGQHVAQNVIETRPTFMVGVPRVWERYYLGLRAKLGALEGDEAKMAEWAQGVGRRYVDAQNHGVKPDPELEAQYAKARPFFEQVRSAVGLDRLRVGVTAAAPIPIEIPEFLSGLSIILYDVFGQSEVTGLATANRPGANRFGSVGRALPGVGVRLAPDGEFLYQGRNVFAGYYEDEAATRAAFTEDGWLRSGDLGEEMEDGYFKVVGRKKDIIITSGGKNIAPIAVESALNNNLPMIDQAIVIGEGRRYITALISLAPEKLAAFAEQHNLPEEGLHEHPAVVEQVAEAIEERVNPLFARVAHVRDFRILPRPLSPAEGELTATLKLRRHVVTEHFSDLIEEMYRE